MAVLHKVGPETCSKCKYRGTFGNEGAADQPVKGIVVCDYVEIVGHSRRSDGNGNWMPDNLKGYCDKFEEGDREPKKFGFNPKTRRHYPGEVVVKDKQLHVIPPDELEYPR